MTGPANMPPMTGDGASAAPADADGSAPVAGTDNGSADVAPAGGLCGTFTCGDSGTDDCGPCADTSLIEQPDMPPMTDDGSAPMPPMTDDGSAPVTGDGSAPMPPMTD